MKVFYELDDNDVRNIIAEKYQIRPEKVMMMDIVMGRGFTVKVDMSDTETPSQITDIPVPDPEDDEEVPQEAMKENDKEKYINRQKLLLELADAVKEDGPEARYRYLCEKKLDQLIKADYTVAQICKLYNLDMKQQYRLYKVVGDKKKAAKKAEGKPAEPEEDKGMISRLKKKQQQRVDENGITWYICPVCEKEFNIEKYPEYSYKTTIKSHKYIFCGYACKRKVERL